MSFSPNAFTTGRNPIVRSVKQASNYITKYITKAETAAKLVESSTRIYFISQNVHSRPELIEPYIKDYLRHKHGAEFYEGDYFTWYRLFNYMDLPGKTRSKLVQIVDEQSVKRQPKVRGRPVISDAKQIPINEFFTNIPG